MSTTTPQTICHHATLEALLEHPASTLTCNEIAGIFGVHRFTVSCAVNAGKLEGMNINARGSNLAARYRIEKSAVVAWLWNQTTGDKASLRAALTARAPHLLRALEAKAAPAATTTAPRAKAAAATPLAHPDLFGGTV